MSISDIYLCTQITGIAFTCMDNEYLLLQLQVDPTSNLLAQMLMLSHTSNKIIFCLYLFLLFSIFYSCLVTKVFFPQDLRQFKSTMSSFGNTTLVPSHQISAPATITHFDALFNFNCCAHAQSLVWFTFAPFCFHHFSA